MGQIFHANCYSSCGTVLSMHYLLRQKAYRIMWGGGYVFLWDRLKELLNVKVTIEEENNRIKCTTVKVE